jgi:hypothetical protein
MPRAEASGISLTEMEAMIAKGMLARGDRQHDIAAWFAPFDKLPPPGPYLTGRDAHAAMIALEAAAETINAALSLIRERTTVASPT